MDQDKKQKILIAVLAVAALGAGGYFFFLREPASQAPALVEGTGARRERTTTAAPTKSTERKERTERAPTTAAVPTERKERAERTEDAAGGRRTRTKGPTEIKKTKKIVPAA